MAEQRSLAERFGPYDEMRMIGYTVMKYQTSLLTEQEYAIALGFFARGKATVYRNPGMEGSLRSRMGVLDDSAVASALELGYESYVEGVVERLLRDRPADLRLNRCPACRKIVLTPEAKWCMWCKFDWHRPD